jgi:hypothetical protein
VWYSISTLHIVAHEDVRQEWNHGNKQLKYVPMALFSWSYNDSFKTYSLETYEGSFGSNAYSSYGKVALGSSIETVSTVGLKRMLSADVLYVGALLKTSTEELELQ